MALRPGLLSKERIETTEPPVTLIDTTSAAIKEMAALVARWIRERAGVVIGKHILNQLTFSHSPSSVVSVKPRKPSGPA